MNLRLKNIKATFSNRGIDAFLVTNETNVSYLSQFSSSESWLLVTKKQVYYITDFRYILEAKKGLKGIVVKRYTHSFYETLHELASQLKIKCLGIDDRHLSYAQFKLLKKHLSSKVTLKTVNNLVEDLREVKEKQEIQTIRKALKIHSEALKMLKKAIKPGVTEKEVLTKLETFISKKNVGFSFDPIVASGPNSCLPHAQVSNRKFRNNEVVLLDMGIDLFGYKSDLTRMFFLGKIPDLVRRVNDHVWTAQRAAIKVIKPGLPVEKVDQVARNSLAKHRLAKYFGHALGHGVGLDIHENPRLSQNNPAQLREGMIITIEPAVYIPNKFGIRIEDMVLVTSKGCEVLSDDID